MTDAPANAEIRAAGAVLWRPSGRGREVAVVHRRRYDDWSFPKGKRERGEHVLLTAVREVAEETGLRVILGRPLPAALYERDGRPKRVDYWAGRPAVGGRASFRPNDEVDELAWLPLPSARGRLSYPRDAVTLDDFAAGPADTVPFVLLRHASAVSKDSWPGEDRERPLDARGAEESERLAHLLACFGSSRVISSPAERCVATVRPYATLTGANLEIETVLGADQADDEPGAGSARVAAIVAAGRPAVICGHRENLPVLLAAACAALGTSPPSDHPLRPAGFWVLHTADGVLAAAEYHHPAGPLPAAPPYPASNTRFCRATASKYLLPMARIAELICYPVKGCAGTPAPDGRSATPSSPSAARSRSSTSRRAREPARSRCAPSPVTAAPSRAASRSGPSSPCCGRASCRWETRFSSPRGASPSCKPGPGPAPARMSDARGRTLSSHQIPAERGADMADNVADLVETELAELSRRLTEPGERECLRCYLLRMISEFGCDGSHRWTVRWRNLRAPRARGLVQQMQRRGGCCCDCEVIFNVFPDYPETDQVLPCAGVLRAGSPVPCDLRSLPRSA